MIYHETIEIPKYELETMQRILNDSKGEYPYDSYEGEIFAMYTVHFEDGREMDIKVCSGVPHYVDAVLLETNGETYKGLPVYYEIACMDVSSQLEGEYFIRCGNDEYYVDVIPGEVKENV